MGARPEFSFGCCVYLVHKLDYSAEIFSKGRVAPIQSHIIPELELMATVVGKRAILLVRDVLNVEINKHIVWCDVITVLQWLTSRKVQSQFVNNRVAELQKVSNLIYRYVPSQDPADVLSRGQRALEQCKNELWWHGFLWLSQECLWPTLPRGTPVKPEASNPPRTRETARRSPASLRPAVVPGR